MHKMKALVTDYKKNAFYPNHTAKIIYFSCVFRLKHDSSILSMVPDAVLL